MLENILKALDVTGDEARTYLALLEHVKPVTAGTLSKQLGLARASLYGYLGRLQDKGLVRQSQQSNIKTFYPEDPKKIDLLFKREIETLEKSRKIFQNILPTLQSKTQHALRAPRFTFFEGVEGVQHVLNDMLLYRDIATSSLWPIKEMMEILSPEFFRYHNTARIKNNISVRALWPKNRVANVRKYPFMGGGTGFLREIRIVPDTIDYTMGYWIYQDKIAYLSSRRESFGFIIESAEMVQTTQAQFDFIWAHSQKTKAQSEETDAFLQEIS